MFLPIIQVIVLKGVFGRRKKEKSEFLLFDLREKYDGEEGKGFI